MRVVRVVASVSVLVAGCSYDVEPGALRGPVRGSSESASAGVGVEPQTPSPTAPAPTAPPGPSPSPSPTPTQPPPGPPPPGDDPGPPPAGCGAVQKDSLGFFRRTSSRGPYVGFVPTSYDGSPMRLVVGLHGCGDDAYNFATWGVSPWATRDTQDWLAISVGGETGGGKCWKLSDAAIVLAAIDDVATCFYVDRRRVVIGGFSSGGELAYSMGLANASRFAGILAENTSLSAAGEPNALLASASWKLPIAHTARTGDTVFPIAGVRADWTKIAAAGFPLEKRELAGGHDGMTDDWALWLLPKSAAWRLP